MLNFILAVSLLFGGAPIDWWNDPGLTTIPGPVGGASRWETSNVFDGGLISDSDGSLLYKGPPKVVVGDPVVTGSTITIDYLSMVYNRTKKNSEVVGSHDVGRLEQVLLYRCGTTWRYVSSRGLAGGTGGADETKIQSSRFQFSTANLGPACNNDIENVDEIRMILTQGNPDQKPTGAMWCWPGDKANSWATYWNTNGGEALPACVTDPQHPFQVGGGRLKIMRIYAGASQIKQSSDTLSMGRCFGLFPGGEIYPHRETTIDGVTYTALELGCTRMTDQQLEDYYNSFDYLCRDAPDWSWTDPTKIGPWTAHYAKCLTVPENINTSKFSSALDDSFIGQLKSIQWSFGTSSAADCGPLINQEIMNATLSINTCDWKEKIPGVTGWRDAFGYIFAGLIAISAVFFIFRMFGGSKE